MVYYRDYKNDFNLFADFYFNDSSNHFTIETMIKFEVNLSYRDWLQLKDERVAECFQGVKIEPTVDHVVILFADRLAELAWEFGVTTQSVVDNFSRELLKGNRPELSLSVIREDLKTYRG